MRTSVAWGRSHGTVHNLNQCKRYSKMTLSTSDRETCRGTRAVRESGEGMEERKDVWERYIAS